MELKQPSWIPKKAQEKSMTTRSPAAIRYRNLDSHIPSFDLRPQDAEANELGDSEDERIEAEADAAREKEIQRRQNLKGLTQILEVLEVFCLK